jgi:hypothetical protein
MLTFLIEEFLICHRCQRHRWCTLSCEYLREFSKKFGTILMGNSGTGGKLIHEKNLKSNISRHCPFNQTYQSFLDGRGSRDRSSLNFASLCFVYEHVRSLRKASK